MPAFRRHSRSTGSRELYANVDVRRNIEERLPPAAKALAGPTTAASRQLALEVEREALASPRVQEVISGAIRRSHEQFVNLVTNRKGYISATNGEVTLAYGQVIADLTVRLGVDPGTISEVRGVVRELEGVELRLSEL